MTEKEKQGSQCQRTQDGADKDDRRDQRGVKFILVGQDGGHDR